MTWLSTIFALIVGAVKGWLGVKAQPTTADLAAGKATAENELAHQEEANAVISEAAAARADADLRVVQSIAPSDIDANANRRIAEQFPDQFRD